MILKTDDAFLKVKTVKSINLYTHESDKVTSNGWLKPKTIQKVVTYSLKINYLDEDGENGTISWTCQDKSPLTKLYNSLVDQIKDNDNQYVDRLLEEAIINGGKDD